MSFVAVAVTAAVVGGALYVNDQQRKAMHKQQDAIRAAQDQDAREKAKAETDAQVAANSQVAATRRRRRDNALALGDPAGSVLGGTSVLGAGAPTAQVTGKPAGTALSAGGR